MRIVYGVLDWGLGHASRSVPVIRALLAKECEVTIASSGLALTYLRKEFENVTFLELPDLQITYSTNERPANWSFVLKGALNYFKLKKYFASCEKLVTQYIEANDSHGLISDGHFGVFSSIVSNLVITHQLNLQAALLENKINKINHEFLSKYDHIWVPDFEGDNSLGGELSRNKSFEDVRYIGALTSYELLPKTNESPKKSLLILLSGPEPQRQKLQTKICTQFRSLEGQMDDFMIDVVSGNPLANSEKLPSNCRHHLMLNSAELNRLLCDSDLVICRSGYSSIMDLVKLKKRAVLIPTPGQGEQEYLARFHDEKGWFKSCAQKEFDLSEILTNDIDFPPTIEEMKPNALQEAIDEFLTALKHTI